jgi:hypothetical protein|tara:strand:+ start:229 stop:411 length:183 start_codon:yes stop_codon:yes gene_type:complete
MHYYYRKKNQKSSAIVVDRSAPCRVLTATRTARALERSKMFGSLTYDGMMRLAHRERSSP